LQRDPRLELEGLSAIAEVETFAVVGDIQVRVSGTGFPPAPRMTRLEVELRHIANRTKADPAYGAGAAALGLEVSKAAE
jgi:hypothetical protein